MDKAEKERGNNKHVASLITNQRDPKHSSGFLAYRKCTMPATRCEPHGIKLQRKKLTDILQDRRDNPLSVIYINQRVKSKTDVTGAQLVKSLSRFYCP